MKLISLILLGVKYLNNDLSLPGLPFGFMRCCHKHSDRRLPATKSRALSSEEAKLFLWLSTDRAVVRLRLWDLTRSPSKRLYLSRPLAHLDNCGNPQLSSLSPSALRWLTQSRSGVYRLPEYQVWGYRSRVLWSASWNPQMISWRNWGETEPKRIYVVGWLSERSWWGGGGWPTIPPLLGQVCSGSAMIS